MPDDKNISEDFKIFKDPIYGYVEIPTDYIKGIVDTPEFQRLRRINQTSYSPLYSSAIHNRFVHSVGVFSFRRNSCKCADGRDITQKNCQ